MAGLWVLPKRMSCLLAATHSRIAADDVGAVPASPNYDNFLLGVGRHGTKGVLSSLVQDQRNRFPEIGEAFLSRRPLTIRTGDLSTVGHIPGPIIFDNGRELVAHLQTFY